MLALAALIEPRTSCNALIAVDNPAQLFSAGSDVVCIVFYVCLALRQGFLIEAHRELPRWRRRSHRSLAAHTRILVEHRGI
jgi:hypothetical protein